MSKKSKKALKSDLTVLLHHLLKYKYQPQKISSSWEITLREQRRRLEKDFDQHGSLKPFLMQELSECYEKARKEAAKETELPIDTFPLECPFTVEQVLDLKYFPK